MVLAIGAVIREHGSGFELQPIQVPEPGPLDVRVRIRAVGICHTDIAVADGHRGVPTPVVLGHEGAGIVEEVGAAVHDVRVGDRVLLSFASCGGCPACSSGRPSLCVEALARNFGGHPPAGSAALRAADGSTMYGSFFGQSSFAELAVTRASAVVPLPDDVPFAVAAPLGCSVQTGAGAVWRSAAVGIGDTVVVAGVGAVGLSAVMAAAAVGAAHVIAVDTVPGRLERASALGATRVVDARQEDLRDAVRDVAPRGADAVIDTTAAPSVVERSLQALRPGGVLALIASGRGDDAVRLGLLVGRRVVGVMQGDSVPRTAVPQLLAAHRAGRMPIERLVSPYPFERIADAVADLRSGAAVKPVLMLDGEEAP